MLTTNKVIHLSLFVVFLLIPCLNVHSLDPHEGNIAGEGLSSKGDEEIVEIVHDVLLQNDATGATDDPEVTTDDVILDTTEPEMVTTETPYTSNPNTTTYSESTEPTEETPTVAMTTTEDDNTTITESTPQTGTWPSGTTFSESTSSTETSPTKSNETTTITEPDVTLTTQSPSESTTSESTTSQPTTTTTTATTTTITPATTTTPVPCSPGFFGNNCSYSCNCLDPHENCDPVSGYCTSGCAPGFYGPGCLAREYGDLSVIVFLAVLLAILLVLCLAQCIYIMVYRPYRKKQQTTHEGYAATNEGYDLDEMAPQDHSSAQRQNSAMPMVEISQRVKRVKETDIQVTSDVLGKGRFGDVLQGSLKTAKGPVTVAFKTIGNDATKETRNAFNSHLEVNSQIEEHDNIIEFFGVATVGSDAFAAFEHASQGNLRNFLRLNGERLSTRNQLLQFALDVAQGMRHIAKKQIVHRELRCEHVLVTQDLTAKVSGLHAPNSANKPSRWMSPEMLLRGDYSIQSDVWSYGVLLWEIMSLGGVPYEDIDVKKLASYLDAGSRLSRPNDCDSDIYGLMRWCWHANPEDRPTFLLLSNTIREMKDSGQIRLDLEDSDIEEV